MLAQDRMTFCRLRLLRRREDDLLPPEEDDLSPTEEDDLSRPFQATATELRAESVGNVPAMDFEAADELQTTPLRDFARARMQEIYDKISITTTNHICRDDPELS